MTEQMDQALEIIELREELQRTKLLLQNCNGDIVRADRELASLRDQLKQQEEVIEGFKEQLAYYEHAAEQHVNNLQKIGEKEEVIRELKSFIDKHASHYWNNETLKEYQSLTTKDK